LRHGGGVGAKHGCLACQKHLHRPAPLLEQPGHDETIATVVARPAKHSDLTLRPSLDDLAGDLFSGVFHEISTGEAAADSCLFRGSHLLRRQYLIVHDYSAHRLTANWSSFRILGGLYQAFGSIPPINDLLTSS
jgi:hypothetical protein